MSSGLRSSVQKRDEGRGRSVEDRRRSACRSFETEPSRIRIVMPLASFSRASSARRRLVVGADAGGEIAVEVAGRAAAAHGRRCGRPGRPRAWRGSPGRVASTPGKFMNSARPITLGWSRKRQQVGRSRSRAPEVSRCVAGTQLDSCTRRSITVALGAVEEVADALGAQHVGDLVRVADRRRDAVRQHAAVELERRDQRGFDVQMRVDEAGHDDAAARRRSPARPR